MSEPAIPDGWHRVEANDVILATDRVWDEKEQSWPLADIFHPDPSTYKSIAGEIAGFYTVIRLDSNQQLEATSPTVYDWNASITDLINRGCDAARAKAGLIERMEIQKVQDGLLADIPSVTQVIMAWMLANKPPTLG